MCAMCTSDGRRFIWNWETGESGALEYGIDVIHVTTGGGYTMSDEGGADEESETGVEVEVGGEGTERKAASTCSGASST